MQSPLLSFYTTFCCNVNLNEVDMGNLFGIEKGIICQQVNCCGVMGAGLAKAIMDKFPVVYEDYRKNYTNTTNNENRSYKCHFNQLGTYRLVQCDNDLYVANIYSQDFYGNPSKTGKVYTKIDKLISSIENIAKSHPELSVYIPHTKNLEGKDDYGIGCGYGGEKWRNVFSKLLDLNLPNIYLLDTTNGTITILQQEAGAELIQ